MRQPRNNKTETRLRGWLPKERTSINFFFLTLFKKRHRNIWDRIMTTKEDLHNQKNCTKPLRKKGFIRINTSKIILNSSREIKIIIDLQVTQVYSQVIEAIFKTSPNTFVAFTRLKVHIKVTQRPKFSLSIRRNTRWPLACEVFSIHRQRLTGKIQIQTYLTQRTQEKWSATWDQYRISINNIIVPPNYPRNRTWDQSNY